MVEGSPRLLPGDDSPSASGPGWGLEGTLRHEREPVTAKGQIRQPFQKRSCPRRGGKSVTTRWSLEASGSLFTFQLP
jgi:hypothetical protein